MSHQGEGLLHIAAGLHLYYQYPKKHRNFPFRASAFPYVVSQEMNNFAVVTNKTTAV